MKSLINVLLWAIAWWYPRVQNADSVMEEWVETVEMWCNTRGSLWTIAHIKSIRLHITRYICGHPLLEAQGSVGLRKDGLPKGVPYLLKCLDTNEGKSFVLTLLNISRCLPGTKQPDLSTITDPWNGYIPYQLKEFIPTFVKLYNFSKFESNFTLAELHNSNKSGPIGMTTQTSVLQAFYASKLEEDLVNITGGYPKPFVVNGREFQPRPAIMKPLDKWGPLANRYLNTLSSIFKSRTPELAKYLRKLSIVNDPEGKARIICIFDYWSQTALKEVHNWAFKQLSLIPNDRTFDQDPYKIKKEGPYYSIDLTAATDRFPIALQKELLKEFSSEAVASSWARLLTEPEIYVPWTQSTVKYNAGQPMGAYSSWAVFALTHHLVVQYSAKMEGESLPFNDYMLLGDDIVIANKAVSERYIATMSELGVGISLYKTHVSDDTYEFAKRWIHKGAEISGIPLRGLIASKDKYNLLVPMIYHIISGMPTRVACDVPGLVYSFFLKQGLPRKQCKALYNRAAEFTAVWKYVKFGNDNMILELIKKNDKHWHPFPRSESSDAREYLDWLLERTVMRETIQINENLKGFLTKFHQKFHKLFVENLVDHTGFKDEIYPALNYHPLWQGTQAELWRVSERTQVIIAEKNWRELLKIVTLPDPDKVIVDRNNHELSQALAKFAKNVFKTAAMQRAKDIWFLAQFD